MIQSASKLQHHLVDEIFIIGLVHERFICNKNVQFEEAPIEAYN